jgi:hypothetical protein
VRNREWLDLFMPVVKLVLATAIMFGGMWLVVECSDGWDRDREARIIRCFGDERVFQCKIAARPGECLSYLDGRVRVECRDDREEGRR